MHGLITEQSHLNNETVGNFCCADNIIYRYLVITFYLCDCKCFVNMLCGQLMNRSSFSVASKNMAARQSKRHIKSQKKNA